MHDPNSATVYVLNIYVHSQMRKMKCKIIYSIWCLWLVWSCRMDGVIYLLVSLQKKNKPVVVRTISGRCKHYKNESCEITSWLPLMPSLCPWGMNMKSNIPLFLSSFGSLALGADFQSDRWPLDRCGINKGFLFFRLDWLKCSFGKIFWLSITVNSESAI